MEESRKKNKCAVRTVGGMLALSLLCKALGLMRSLWMASRLGSGESAAAFAAALRIPALIFDLLPGALISGCLVPVYQLAGNVNREEASDFAGSFFLASLLCGGFLSWAGFVFSPWLIGQLAPGLDADCAREAARLLRILFLSTPWLGMTYVCAGILQSKGNDWMPAGASGLSNLVLLLCLFFLPQGSENKSTADDLAWVYALSWILQLGVLLGPVFYRRYAVLRCAANMRRLRQNWKEVGIRALPAMAASLFFPAGTLMNLPRVSRNSNPGALALYDYSSTLWMLAAGFFTLAVCNYLFPRLSAEARGGERFHYLLGNGLGSLLALTLPTALLLHQLALQIVQLFYGRSISDAGTLNLMVSMLKTQAFFIPAYALFVLGTKACLAEGKGWAVGQAALAGLAVQGMLSHLFPETEWLLLLPWGAGLAVSAAVIWWKLAAEGRWGNPRHCRFGVLFRSASLGLLLLLLFGICLPQTGIAGVCRVIGLMGGGAILAGYLLRRILG